MHQKTAEQLKEVVAKLEAQQPKSNGITINIGNGPKWTLIDESAERVTLFRENEPGRRRQTQARSHEEFQEYKRSSLPGKEGDFYVEPVDSEGKHDQRVYEKVGVKPSGEVEVRLVGEMRVRSRQDRISAHGESYGYLVDKAKQEKRASVSTATDSTAVPAISPMEPPAPSDVLQKVAAELPAQFTAQDLRGKLDELLSREQARGEEANTRLMDGLTALKQKCDSDPSMQQRVNEAINRTRTELSKPFTAGSGMPIAVSDRPLERIGGSTGTVVDGVVRTTTAGDAGAPLPADVVSAIDKQREELTRRLSEVDKQRESDPKNEALERQRTEITRQLDDLQRAKTDPVVRGKVTEWLRANSGTIGKGVGAAALFLFIYSFCASNANASERAEHARISR